MLILFIRFCVRLVRIVSLYSVTIFLILCLLFELKQLQVDAQCFHPKLLLASKLGLGFVGFGQKAYKCWVIEFGDWVCVEVFDEMGVS